MDSTFGARVVVRDFEPGWRLLASGGRTDRLEGSEGPSLHWSKLIERTLAVDLDGENARQEAAALLSAFGYARHPEDAKTSDLNELRRWTSESVSDSIMIRLRSVQAFLRMVNRPDFDMVEQIASEYRHEESFKRALGQALVDANNSSGGVSTKQIEQLLVRHRRQVLNTELFEELAILKKEKGWTDADIVEQLTGKKPKSPKKFTVERGVGRLISDSNIAARVTQWLTNRGIGPIKCSLEFAANGVPTVYISADDPFGELVLRAHTQRTLPEWLLCENPRCLLKGPFRRSKHKRFCTNKCQDDVKKAKLRSIAKAQAEWEAMSSGDRRGVNRASWIAERATDIASQKMRGRVIVDKADVERREA